MNIACIISVGTGMGPNSKSRETQINGLKYILKQNIGNKLFFLVSSKSKETVEKVIDDIKNEITFDYEFIDIGDDVDDFNHIRDVLLKRVKEIKSKFKEVKSYPFGGTKIMNYTLLYVSLIEDAHIFVIPAKRGDDYLAIAGTEYIYSINPFEKYDIQRLKIIEFMFNSGYFNSAYLVSKDIINNKIMLNGIEIKKEALMKLIKFFYFVDTFSFKDSIELNFDDEIPSYVQKVISYYLSLAKNIVNFKKVDEKSQKIKIVNKTIAEMYRNALREIKKGKFDDAVERFYRILEFIIQLKLYEKFDVIISDYFGTITSKIGFISKVGKDNINELNEIIGKNSEEVKVGLKKAYDLFNLLSKINEKENIFKNMDKNDFNKLLSLRNNSLLAHGINPIGEKTANEMKDFVEKILTDLDMYRYVNEMDFPEIKLDL